MSSELLSPAFLINGILALVLKTTNYSERAISKIRRKYSLLPYNCRKTHTILYDTLILQVILRHQVALAVKNSPASSGNKRCRFNPCVRKIPWGRTWQFTTVFLPGESHGQRRLVDYSQKGYKESDTAEAT